MKGGGQTTSPPTAVGLGKATRGTWQGQLWEMGLGRSRHGSHTRGIWGLFSLCALRHLLPSPMYAYTSSDCAHTSTHTDTHTHTHTQAHSYPDHAGVATSAHAWATTGWWAEEPVQPPHEAPRQCGTGRELGLGVGVLCAGPAAAASRWHRRRALWPCPVGSLSPELKELNPRLASESQAPEGQVRGTPGLSSLPFQKTPCWPRSRAPTPSLDASAPLRDGPPLRHGH